jgi:hypothetical protein
MDDLPKYTEESLPVASEGTFWNSQDDAKLWYHYRNGDIDPYNNNREYLLEKTQQYFPAKCQRAETAIRRLRDKNKRRKLELSVAGARRGKWLIVVLFVYIVCNVSSLMILFRESR